MSPIPSTPSSTGDAEKVIIDLLKLHLEPDWGVSVAKSKSRRKYNSPLVTVQQLSTTPRSQSFNGTMWQEDFLIDIKVYGSTAEEKSQLREAVKRIFLDYPENPGQDFCYISLGPTRDLDSIDQAEDTYADNISITLTRYLVKGGT